MCREDDSRKVDFMNKINTFLTNVNKELGKVKWSSKKEMIAYSTAVIVFIVVFAFFFLGTDIVLSSIMKLIG